MTLSSGSHAANSIKAQRNAAGFRQEGKFKVGDVTCLLLTVHFSADVSSDGCHLSSRFHFRSVRTLLPILSRYQTLLGPVGTDVSAIILVKIKKKTTDTV